MSRVLTIAIFAGVILFDSPPCLGQKARILNIWLGDKQSLTEDYVLYLNGRRITSLRPKELVSYKTYTYEPINIEIISGRSGLLKYSDQFPLDESDELFFQANTRGYPPKGFIEQLTKNEASVYFQKKEFFIKKRIFEEDINNSIGKISGDYRNPTQGSGFLLNREGYVMTCFHIVEDAEKIMVSGINGDMSSFFDASLVASDRLLDIAILKIESTIITFPTPSYSFSNSECLRTGEAAIAFGYPIADALGYELKVTNGIVNSTTGYKNSFSTLQFSAPIQPGNSGGPLMNSKGQIIGLISSKISSSSVESVNYAIKSSYIEFFLNQIRKEVLQQPANNETPKELIDLIDEVKDMIFLIKTK